MIRTLLIPLLFVGACGDETISGYAEDGATWHLTELDGAAWPSHASLTFTKPGTVTGQAPCNRFSAEQTAPYPWFKVGPIIATRMACSELDAERVFFQALRDMTLAEAVGPVLILSNDNGQQMVFEARGN